LTLDDKFPCVIELPDPARHGKRFYVSRKWRPIAAAAKLDSERPLTAVAARSMAAF
jgi:hypothetical protein